MLTIHAIQLPHAEGLPLPSLMTAGSAGADLVAAVTEDVLIAPGQRTLVPTGLILEIPEGYEGQVRPRSGLAIKHGITLLNSPGTIDSDYRGEVKVILANLGQETFTIQRGDRIAQLIISPVQKVRFAGAEEVSANARGAGGFGHTGTAV